MNSRGHSLEYFMHLFLRHSIVFLGQNVRLSTPIFTTRPVVILSTIRLQPDIIQFIRRTIINILNIWIKVASTDLTVRHLAIILDRTTRLTHILVNIDLLHQQIIVKIFSHIFFLQLSLLHRFFQLVYYHVTTLQQRHKNKSNLCRFNIRIYTLTTQHQLSNVVHLRHLLHQLRNYNVNTLSLRQTDVWTTHDRVTSFNKTSTRILYNVLELWTFR